MKNFEQQLKSLKSSKRIGSWDSAARAQVRARVMNVVKVEAARATPVQSLWFVSQFISRPLTIGTAAFVLLTGGWSATVSAAAGSLPGDSFYSVKRITEEAQLRLASLDRRAVLHTEFASRRLDEAEALVAAADTRPEAKALAHQALTDYKDQLARATADVVEINKASDPAAKTLVSSVGNKITELSAALDKTSAVQDQSSADIHEVKEAAASAASAVASAVVDVHESSASDSSERELKAMFSTLLGKVQARQTMNRHRIDVMSAMLGEDPERFKNAAGVPKSADLGSLAVAVANTSSAVDLAMSALTTGGYRAAFDELEKADRALLATEQQIAAYEFSILSAPEIETEAITPKAP